MNNRSVAIRYSIAEYSLHDKYSINHKVAMFAAEYLLSMHSIVSFQFHHHRPNDSFKSVYGYWKRRDKIFDILY
jgi:hypothetical protein